VKPSNSYASASQLQDHVNGCPRGNIVAFQSFVVRQLLSTVNQFDLVHLNALLFLQSLLHGQNLVLRLKVQRLFAPCQRFDKDLDL